MILILGSGAVGTVLAGRLVAGGHDVRLYARDKDVSAFQSVERLRIDADKRTALSTCIAVPPLCTGLNLQDVDYLFICVKSAALPGLLECLPAQLPARCRVVSTLNGISALRQVRNRWPGAEIIPLSIMMNVQLLAPLHAALTTRAEVVVGNNATDLQSLFKTSGLHVKMATGDEAVWGKLLINLANAICALCHTTFEDLFRNAGLREIYVGVLDEATAAMNAANVQWKLPLLVPYPVYRWMLLHAGPLPWWFAKYRNGVRSGAYPSMVSDIEAGRATEVQELNGEIVRIGRAHNIATPLNTTLMQLIESSGASPRMSASQLKQKLQIQ